MNKLNSYNFEYIFNNNNSTETRNLQRLESPIGTIDTSPPQTTNQTTTTSKKKKNKNKKNKKNEGNNNNNNLKIGKSFKEKSKSSFTSITFNNYYRLFSPFKRYLEFGVLPTFSDLTTEFYHILCDDCTLIREEVKSHEKEIKLKEKLNSSNQLKEESNFRKSNHSHTVEELERVFNSDSKESVEKVVRKICGFLEREPKMYLVEILIRSIGITESLLFLTQTLELEKRGILIKSKNSDQFVRKTPGGIFFSLIKLNLDQKTAETFFTQAYQLKYLKLKNESTSLQKVQVPKVIIQNTGSSDHWYHYLTTKDLDLNFENLNLK